jgi:hypothetical protein
MEIQLSMEILQVAMTVDKPGQNGLALDVDHLRVGGNQDFPAPADGFEPASPDNDGGILDRWPAGAVDQSSTLHHESLLCHLYFSFLLSTIGLLRDVVPMTNVVTSLLSGLASRRAPLLPGLGDQETNITRKRTVNSKNAIAKSFNGGYNPRGPARVYPMSYSSDDVFKNSRRNFPWPDLTLNGGERVKGLNVFNALTLTRD